MINDKRNAAPAMTPERQSPEGTKYNTDFSIPDPAECVNEEFENGWEYWDLLDDARHCGLSFPEWPYDEQGDLNDYLEQARLA